MTKIQGGTVAKVITTWYLKYWYKTEWFLKKTNLLHCCSIHCSLCQPKWHFLVPSCTFWYFLELSGTFLVEVYFELAKKCHPEWYFLVKVAIAVLTSNSNAIIWILAMTTSIEISIVEQAPVYVKGVIHKPRGQKFGYFWHLLPILWLLLLNEAYLIKWSFGWVNPTPITVRPRGLWMSPMD